jgi:zinc transport system substrate-binding protein
MKKVLFLLMLVSVFMVSGCGKNEDIKSGKINVFTSIIPQKYFVERIGGDRVSVNVLVGPGKSPATYEPLPDQVIALGAADLFFTIGVNFEKAFIPKIAKSLQSLRIVDTSEGIKKRTIESDDHDDHGEDEHGHEAGAPDPHIWMSARLVKQQALNIYNALAEKDPEGKEVYKKGYESFIADLDKADAELKKALEPFKGRTLFVFHPAFGYFADEYGFKQVAIETGGKEPSPSVLESIIKKAKADKVKVIFVQPEFSQKSARAVAKAIGGSVITLNPLNPDYLNNLLYIAAEVKKAL